MKKSSRLEMLTVQGIAIATAGMGLINVLSAITPAMEERLHILREITPLFVRQGSHLAAALAGFALLLLSNGLWQHKRFAWMTTLVVLVISTASHLIKGLDFEEAALALLLAAWMISQRSHFNALSDPPSVIRGVKRLALAFVFTLFYGIAGFYLLDRHFSVHFGLWDALRQTIVMFSEFYNPGLEPLTGFGRYFATSIYMIGAITIGYALLELLRPVILRSLASDSERAQAEKIVQAHGHSSLARFVLLNDKAYFFSPGGSVIGYTVINHTAVALGDPIGPTGDIAAAVQSFKEFCARNGWVPVFYQTLPETLAFYRECDFHHVCIGYEGIVDLATFTIEGKTGKPLRAPINHMKNLGYRFAIQQPPLSDSLLNELRSISDEWLTMMHGSEKRFSLGWFDDNYVRGSTVGTIYDAAGGITAFANIVPEYQRNEITLDLMRRRKEIENGTMEFLFVSFFTWAKQQGYATFNLGLSALSGVGEKSDDPAVERFMHFIYENVDQFYNFKGLHAFKEKFHPTWEPRHLIYPGIAYFASAWAAVVQANSGGNDLSLANLLRGFKDIQKRGKEPA